MKILFFQLTFTKIVNKNDQGVTHVVASEVSQGTDKSRSVPRSCLKWYHPVGCYRTGRREDGGHYAYYHKITDTAYVFIDDTGLRLTLVDDVAFGADCWC